LILTIVVVSIVFLIIMLIFRELWGWYFKLNKMVSLLTDIREALQNPGTRSPAPNTASTNLNLEGLSEIEKSIECNLFSFCDLCCFFGLIFVGLREFRQNGSIKPLLFQILVSTPIGVPIFTGVD